MHTYRTLLACVALCLLTGRALAFDEGRAAERPPNVLFLFTDDQRFDTIHALGNDTIRTPNLDRLVRTGTAFTRAYIMGGTSPAVCSPSRAALFSGRTLWNLDNQGMWGFEISEKHITLPQAFKEAGYETFATGKNEPGKAGHFVRSFSTGDKILFRGMTRDQYVLPLYDNPADGTFHGKKPVTHRGTHAAEVYADATIRFLENRGENAKPFFAYVSFQTPHDPRQSPESYRARYKDEDMPLPEAFMPEHPFDNGMLKIRDEKLAGFPRTPGAVKKHLADYYATIEHTDAQVGRIIDALGKAGERANTIIVFTSDNGLAVGSHGLMGKQNVYDHSVHVPLIVAGPGIPEGERRDQLCYIYDLYPTLCERAGIPTPATVEYRSLNPALADARAEHRDHLYFAFMAWQRSVQRERFKLIEYCVDNKRHTQLFDLLNDPNELSNLAEDPAYADTLRSLRALLKRSAERLNDGDTPYDFTDRMGKRFWGTYASGEGP